MPVSVYTVLSPSCISSAFVSAVFHLLIPLAYRLNCLAIRGICVLVLALALMTVLVAAGAAGRSSCNLRVAKGVSVCCFKSLPLQGLISVISAPASSRFLFGVPSTPASRRHVDF
jgi:hypothetical protein